MRDFVIFLVALAVIIFCLFLLYSFCHFWFRNRNSQTVDVYPVVELRRPTFVQETATFVSVFYSSNEVTLKNEIVQKPACSTTPSEESPTDSKAPNNDAGEEKAPVDSKKKVEEKKKNQPKTVESIQAGHMQNLWTAKELGCELAIGVHANEERIGGYCLDLKNKTCEFYSYETFRLPWTLKENEASASGEDANGSCTTKVDKKWLSECQAKNMMFALILWEDKIKELKKFKLYTDDDTSRKPENEYGRRLRTLLSHMEDCEKLYKVNTMIVLNNPISDSYIRYILPAVELSRLRLPYFADYISGAYGIERFDGTHEYVGEDEQQEKEGKKTMIYYTTKYFETFLLRVKKRVLDWKLNPCYTCKFAISKSPSLQSILVSASRSQPGRPVLDKSESAGSKNSTMGKANATSLKKKNPKSPFQSFKWKKSDSHDADKYTKKHCHDLDPSAPPDSEDSLSVSSKTTSGDYATSKSNYSSKGNMRFFR